MKKQPLNMLVNPEYPMIRKAGPIFKDAGKGWHVDVGTTQLDTRFREDFIADAVLSVSRDGNKQWTYGVSSHKDVVNKAFRPPIIPLEEKVPLNRIPRGLVVPRINPGSSSYTAVVQPFCDSKPITEAVKSTSVRPTFYNPQSRPIDNSVLPDLQLKRENFSLTAGFSPSMTIDAPLPDVTLEFTRLRPDENAGYEIPFKISAPDPKQNMELGENRPSYSVTSGVRMPFTRNGETKVPDMDDLQIKQPHVPVSAGFSTPVTIDGENGYERLQLGTKTETLINDFTLLGVGPDNLDLQGVVQHTNVDDYIDSSRIEAPMITQKEYSYRDHRNVMSNVPKFRTKIVPRGSISSNGVRI